jgi:hypothetical protein
MEHRTANIIVNKALEAIKTAFANDKSLKDIIVSNAGGSFTKGVCTVRLSFVDKNHAPSSIFGGEVSDEIVSLGAAGAGTKIMFRGKRYTVVKAARKYYNAIDEAGKAWRVPFENSTLAPN